MLTSRRPNSTPSLLRNLVPKHRAALLAALQAAGVTPFGQGAAASPMAPAPATNAPSVLVAPTTVNGLVCTSHASTIVLEGFNVKELFQELAFIFSNGPGPGSRNTARVETDGADSYTVTFASSPQASLDIWDFDGNTAKARYWLAPGLKVGEYDCIMK